MIIGQTYDPENIDIWIMNVLLQSIIESVYSGIFFTFDSGGWDISKIKYFPIWTRDKGAMYKRVSRLIISYENRDFKMVTNEMISKDNLLTLDEICEFLEKCNAHKIRPPSFNSIKSAIFEDSYIG